ncbi:MAG: gluconokinase [Bacteroidota bacterium]
MNCIITIELGTNAVRVFAFDLDGNEIGSQRGYCPTLHTGPDYSEQDPDHMFITMLYSLKNLLTEYVHPGKYKVSTICFSSSMHSVLAVDKTGTPLGNAITWSDNRAKKIAQELKDSELGKALYTRTGTPLHPMSPLAKISWMKEFDKERFKQTSKFLSIKSYIIHQLTDKYLIDYSIASATGLLNIHDIKWDQDALNFAGIKKSSLPELVPILTEAGKLKKAYQNSLGLTADTRIIIGSSDGCMATLGDGVMGEGRATITLEDSGAVRVMGARMLEDDKQRFFNYLLTEDCYVSGGPTNNAGSVFEWFARQFGDCKNAFEIDYSIHDLMEEASKVSAGSEGLLFLPYLLGERAPIWNANARGSYFGLNIKHEKKHFTRATIEGVLYGVYNIGKTLEEHRNITSLSVNGSYGTLSLCSKMIADIFNKPVALRSNSHSVSYGTYLVAATEMGVYKNLDEAAKTVKLPDEYLPDKTNHETYMQYFKIFEQLSTKLAPEFEIIANIS